MSTIKIRKILANIYKNVENKNWKCVVKECNNNSINSHFLQKNGILDNLAVDDHLMEIQTKDIFKWNRDEKPIEIKRVSKNKAFSLPVFCKYHDNSIFDDIEKQPIDLSSYKTHLLLSYRVICAEIRKKEKNIEVFNRVLNANTLQEEIDLGYIEKVKEGNEMGLEDLLHYKQLLEDDLWKKSLDKKFIFYTQNYPLHKIFCSAIFSPVNYEITDPKQTKALNSVFIHIIPFYGKLTLVIGYHEDYCDDWIKKYVSKWLNLEIKEFQKMLTNLFSEHIENWGMSPDLYDSLDKTTLKEFIDKYYKNLNNYSRSMESSINLFDQGDE